MNMQTDLNMQSNDKIAKEVSAAGKKLLRWKEGRVIRQRETKHTHTHTRAFLRPPCMQLLLHTLHACPVLDELVGRSAVY